MKKLTLLIVMFVCVSSCNTETNKKKDGIVTYAVNDEPTDTLAIYITVLDILIKTHTYNRYLVKEGDSKKTLFMIDGNFKNHENKVNDFLFPKDFEVDFDLANKKINTPVDIKVFKSDLVNIKLVSKIDAENNDAIVEKLTLSTMYLNQKANYGLLYFGFVCGPKCGEGNILTTLGKLYHKQKKI